jgi:beta-phosphoglucomutase-like phosphatase (HAD superfamily)
MTGSAQTNAGRTGAGGLGLPEGVTACVFDVDGVLTDTAGLHNAVYLDGKPRPDGVRNFLASRGIRLPEGEPDDPPGAETVHGLGNRKNEALLRRLHEQGVEVFEGSRRYPEAARDAGLRRVVVSSSATTAEVLTVTGLSSLVEGWIDGHTIAAQGMKGKPAPDTFLAGARSVGVEPTHAVVFEDALVGVAAGRAGGLGFVVAVDRTGHAELLNGANGEAAR